MYIFFAWVLKIKKCADISRPNLFSSVMSRVKGIVVTAEKLNECEAAEQGW